MVNGRELNHATSTTLTITYKNKDGVFVKYLAVMEKGTIAFYKNQGDQLNFVTIGDSTKINSIGDFIETYKGPYISVANPHIDNLENFVDVLENSNKKPCSSHVD